MSTQRYIGVIPTRLGFRPALFGWRSEAYGGFYQILSVRPREKTKPQAVSSARDWAAELKLEYR